MDSGTIEVTVHSSIGDIAADEWDACADPDRAAGGYARDPFVTHRFFKALEDSGSVGPGTGWVPHPMVARMDGEIIGALPLFAKGHSQGEYVFDHSWAHALERAGGQYYPKLQVCVPFTPVTGPRYLARPGFEVSAQAALTEASVRLAVNNGLSSVHVTFCTRDEYQAGGQMEQLQRTGQQFHWINHQYTDFEGFLAALSSRKRKTIRRERRTAQGFGGHIETRTGEEIEPSDWDDIWRFYQDTGARKWGSPYLTRAFFDEVQKTMRDDVLLVFAVREGRRIAGAMNLVGRDTLFGRYWGCTEHHDCLHFEICYYQAIDFAIKNGLSKVEAGAQGQHKLARGYMPVETYSLHWIAEEGFRRAVGEYLDQERAAVGEEIEFLTSYGPFRCTHEEEQE